MSSDRIFDTINRFFSFSFASMLITILSTRSSYDGASLENRLVWQEVPQERPQDIQELIEERIPPDDLKFMKENNLEPELNIPLSLEEQREIARDLRREADKILAFDGAALKQIYGYVDPPGKKPNTILPSTLVRGNCEVTMRRPVVPHYLGDWVRQDWRGHIFMQDEHNAIMMRKKEKDPEGPWRDYIPQKRRVWELKIEEHVDNPFLAKITRVTDFNPEHPEREGQQYLAYEIRIRNPGQYQVYALLDFTWDTKDAYLFSANRRNMIWRRYPVFEPEMYFPTTASTEEMHKALLEGLSRARRIMLQERRAAW